jgi:hypothetical protein
MTGTIAFESHGLSTMAATFLTTKVLDLIALLGDIFVAADDEGVIALLFAFARDVVADDFEKRVVERKQ